MARGSRSAAWTGGNPSRAVFGCGAGERQNPSVAGRRRSVLDSVSVILAILAGLVFLSSDLRAMLYASTATSKMNIAFPAVPGAAKTSPFSFFRLFGGSKPAAVDVQTFDYSTHDDVALQLDFYGAQGRSEPAPCVIVLPGGGWEHGDRLEFATMNHYLAQRGYSVAAISYRLAPKSIWPAQQEDLIAALSYLKGHASELNIDPDRFVLFGRSAGGQIVEAVAAPANQPGIVGCIAFYAPADMQFAYKYAKRGDILNSEKLLKQYLGGTPVDVADSYDTASGYLHVNPKTPPTLLLHGANDELVWVQQSQRYSDRLRSNEVRQVFLRLPWATHAFDYNFNGPGGQLATWAVERFLASVTGS